MSAQLSVIWTRSATMFMVSGLFIAMAVPAGVARLAAVGAIIAATLIGVVATLIVSRILASTSLRGEPSGFRLELPPYRRPRILQVLYRSLIDRTIFVLGRAMAIAAPAGGVIWLLENQGWTLTTTVCLLAAPRPGRSGKRLGAYVGRSWPTSCPWFWRSSPVRSWPRRCASSRCRRLK